MKQARLVEQKLFFIRDTGNLVEPALSVGNAGDLADHYSLQENGNLTESLLSGGNNGYLAEWSFFVGNGNMAEPPFLEK